VAQGRRSPSASFVEVTPDWGGKTSPGTLRGASAEDGGLGGSIPPGGVEGRDADRSSEARKPQTIGHSLEGLGQRGVIVRSGGREGVNRQWKR